MAQHTGRGFSRRRFCGARGVAVLLFTVLAVVSIPAQEYEILGSLETRGIAAYRKDSPVVVDPELRATWYATALARLDATHRVTGDQGELVIDHAITSVPASVLTQETDLLAALVGTGGTTGNGTAGTAGTGSTSATSVVLSHEIYQAYVGVFPTSEVSFRFGRQRLNWGMGWTFSVSDALHPQSSDSEVEPGLDGVVAGFLPGPNFSVEAAVAAQDTIAGGDLEDLRYALYGGAWIAPVDLSLSVVYQYATMLRPGAAFSVPVGPFLVAGEGAVEIYDPRAEEYNLQPLASIGAEYSWYGDRTDVVLVGEYVYNGLAETYPGAGAQNLAVTSDFAGGFQRPGFHYVSASATLAVSESWSTDHSVLVNATDESYLVRHGLTLLRIPAVDLHTAVTWNAGEAGTEFGLLQEGMVVEVGATAHF